ncbi:MAG: MFS transporter, partial [Bacteroidales bacterium]|nr:MFS transporter [Bacteroidales bacterium]
MRNSIITLLLSIVMATTTNAGEWIRINQLGYLPHATKVAVFMSNDPASVDSFELVDAFTEKVVYQSGQVRSTAPLQHMKYTCRLNFSDFQRQGSYFIRVGKTTSPIFAINRTVYNGTADFVLNYMRQQQCGYNPFQRDSCHTKDAYVRYHPTKEGQRLDVRGGWHDAADLLQYTTTSANAIYQLMFAYQQNPVAFTDHFDANGDKGANGVPDIVDQIKWGLDWLDRMNPEKGELYNLKEKKDGDSYMTLLRKYVLTNKYIWILSVAFLCVYFVRYVTLSWAAIFLESRELSKASIPLIFTLNPLVGALGGITAGILTDKVFRGRCSPVNILYFVLLAISAYGFYCFAGPSHVAWTCFFIAAIGFFVDGPQNLLNVQISFLTTKESVAAACGFCGLFAYIGGFLAGSGASVILNHWGWAGVFNSCIIACIVGVLLVLTVVKKENRDVPVHNKK